jgi:histidinol phosphatase-like PHP family hydrolase
VEVLDAHAHTNLSYCAAEDLTLAVYRNALDEPGGLLGRQAITNHGFQAYFPYDLAWSWEFLDKPKLFDRHRSRGDDALLAFREEMEALRDDRFFFGVEVELMGDGRLTVSDSVRQKADLIVGSLHVLPSAYNRGPSADAVFASFADYTRDLLAAGVDVIAHPLRWLVGAAGVVPREIVTELVALAAASGAAVELNLRGCGVSHVALIREAVSAGVPLALATDAHAVAEVGRLEEHMTFIRGAGYDPAGITLYEGPEVRAS